MSDNSLPAQVPLSEMELARQQDEHQFQIACQQLEANLQNMREQREFHKYITVKNNRAVLILFIIGMIGFFGFGIIALFLDKEALLADLLKVAAGFVGGGGVGFYFGLNKRDSIPPQP